MACRMIGELGEEQGLHQLQQDGAEHDAVNAAHAAEDDHDEEHGGDVEVEHLRGGGLQLGDEEHAGHAGKRGTDGECEQLEADGVDAHGARRRSRPRGWPSRRGRPGCRAGGWRRR